MTSPFSKLAKPVDHLAALHHFERRLETDLTPETRARLESIVAIYRRLYEPG
jgi:uncharacterized protein YbgA (DUF1722 family)